MPRPRRCAAPVFAACLGIGISPLAAPAATIQATSSAETCDWLDPTCWDLEPELGAPVAPNNDAIDFFAVRVGTDPVPSVVSLDGSVTVDRVQVAPDSTLQILGGAQLTLEYDPVRPSSGTLENNGVLALGSAQAGGRLIGLGTAGSDPDVEITGAGTILLSDRTDNFIGATQFPGLFFELGAEQLLSGAGTVELITNRGTIEATGVNPLVLDSSGGWLRNEGILRAIGSGGLQQAPSSDIQNTGLVEVADGSRLIQANGAEFQNGGTFRVRGANAYADVTLSNGGLVEVLDGATLTAQLSFEQYGGMIRVGQGSTFEGGGSLGDGDFRLEDGLVRGGLAFAGGRFDGIGTVGTLSFTNATLATGLEGVGRLDVEGNVSFLNRSVWEVDLAGTSTDDYDRLAASGAITFTAPSSYPGSRIDLAYLPGFDPAAADRVELASASTIFAQGLNLRDLFTAPALPGDLYFAPQIIRENTLHRLRLHVLEPIAATWTAGDGSYLDAAGWSFGGSTTATIPSNAQLDVFDVRIGSAGQDSTVSLDGPVSIHRLHVDAGDALLLGSQAQLLLQKQIGRPEAREVWNDGTIRINGGRVTGENGLAFRGAGTLYLSGGSSYVGAVSDSIDITNEAGHTISGAGSISTTTNLLDTIDRAVFRNAGMVAATEIAELFIDGAVENDGTMAATGSGGIRISQQLTQRGLLRVAAGSQARVGDAWVFGRELVQEGESAVTEVGAGAVLVAGSVELKDGRFVLDGGTIEPILANASTNSFTIREGARLEGYGTVVFPVTVEAGGVIAPGASGIGRLEIQDRLEMWSGANLEMEIAGTGVGLQDRLEGSDFVWLNGLSVSFLGGFAPTQGDVFDLVRATSLSGTRNIEGAALGGGLFLVPELRDEADSETLRLRTKREIAATWIGASGNYSSSPNWSFSVAPVSASVPANDDLDLFDVEIGAAGPVDAALASTARIDSLSLGPGSTFGLGADASLILTRTPERSQSGRIVNDGVIRIGSESAAASLRFEGDLEITGQGVIEIGDSSTLAPVFSNPSLDSDSRLMLGAGQTIRGGGFIGGLDNHGRVEATGATAMSLGSFVNDGTVRAIGSGGVMFTAGTNRGRFEVGAGSTARAVAFLVNDGQLDIESGGSFTGRVFQNADEASVTRVAGSLTSARGATLEFQAGALDLDGGTVTLNEGTLRIGPNGRLEGDGEILHQGRFGGDVVIEGVLAPGHDGIGTIQFARSLRMGTFLPTGSISIELAGTGSHDLVRVLGTSALWGTIDVDLVETAPGQALFAPAAGDVFDVLIAQTIDDSQVTYDLPELAGGLAWQTGVVQDGGVARLRLLVVPEPSTATLLLVGLIALARSRGRR